MGNNILLLTPRNQQKHLLFFLIIVVVFFKKKNKAHCTALQRTMYFSRWTSYLHERLYTCFENQTLDSPTVHSCRSSMNWLYSETEHTQGVLTDSQIPPNLIWTVKRTRVCALYIHKYEDKWCVHCAQTRTLTQQQQFDFSGRLLSVFPQVPIDYFAPLDRCFILCAESATHLHL